MPRYLVERTYTVGMDKLPVIATRSKALGHHRFPEITWEHSHVVLDSAGVPMSFCVYEAPSPEAIRSAAARNRLPIDRITQVRGQVTHNDKPLYLFTGDAYSAGLPVMGGPASINGAGATTPWGVFDTIPPSP